MVDCGDGECKLLAQFLLQSRSVARVVAGERSSARSAPLHTATYLKETVIEQAHTEHLLCAAVTHRYSTHRWHATNHIPRKVCSNCGADGRDRDFYIDDPAGSVPGAGGADGVGR